MLALYFSAMKPVLEGHGGTIEKYIGDAIMAVFGMPRMHEDDALRAVRAAARMREALEELNVTLRAGFGVTLENRTGVNTGEVVTGDTGASQRLATGDTVNVAARLEQAAPAGEVLIGESTYRLVRDAVEVVPVEPLTLKGKPEPVPAYRLLSVTEGVTSTRPADLPLVGRAREIAALNAEFRRSIAGSECRLVTLLGEAGVGKSRLIEEFVRSFADEATVLQGRCLSYGDGITFWPLAEVLRQAAGIVPEDSEEDARVKLKSYLGEGLADATSRIESGMGLSEQQYGKDELFWASGRSSRSWLAAGRSWWSSTTSTGRSQPSSISSRKSSTPRSVCRSSSSARPAMSSTRTGRVLPRGGRRRPRSSSGNSPERRAASWCGTFLARRACLGRSSGGSWASPEATPCSSSRCSPC